MFRNDSKGQVPEWVGGSFHPELFDMRAANASLSRMAWNGWGQK